MEAKINNFNNTPFLITKKSKNIKKISFKKQLLENSKNYEEEIILKSSEIQFPQQQEIANGTQNSPENLSSLKTESSLNENIETLNLRMDEDLRFFKVKQNLLAPLNLNNENYFLLENSKRIYFNALDSNNFIIKKEFEKKIQFLLSDELLNIIFLSEQESYMFPQSYLKPYPAVSSLSKLKSFKNYESKPMKQFFYFNFQFTIFMRAQIVDWIMEVCQDFQLSKFSFSASINYMDRFFSNAIENHFINLQNEDNYEIYSISKEDLQLIGATSLYLAAKMEEINQLSMQSIISATACCYTVKEIESTEILLLRNLQFLLNAQNLNTWLDFILFYWDLFTQNINNTCKQFGIMNCLHSQYNYLSFLQDLATKQFKYKNNMDYDMISFLINYLHFDFNQYKNQEFEVVTSVLFIYIFNSLEIHDEEFEFELIKSYLNFVCPERQHSMILIIQIIQSLSSKLIFLLQHPEFMRNVNYNLANCLICEQYFIKQQFYPQLVHIFKDLSP